MDLDGNNCIIIKVVTSVLLIDYALAPLPEVIKEVGHVLICHINISL